MVKGVQETPETIKAIAIVLGCLSNSEVNALLLETPHTSGTWLGGMKQEMTWKPWEEENLVSKWVIQVDKGKKQLKVLQLTVSVN